MKDHFKAFFDAYAIASALFREGDLTAIFPDQAFPPALPFQPGIRAGPVAI
jgi:hypothetical protein